jgi:hypothetical protein
MKTVYNRVLIQALFLCILISFASCNKEGVPLEPVKAHSLNTFGMEINGEAWEPGQIGKDECMRTYYGAWSSLNAIPFFNIVAYRDPTGLTGVKSENALQIQIMNVNGLGKYDLTGYYLESLKSNASFAVKKLDGTYVRYINRRGVPSFFVVFTKFITIPKTDIKGVEGSFYGTLYNEVDPLDSITLTKGNFTFNKPNRYNFDQCD